MAVKKKAAAPKAAKTPAKAPLKAAAKAPKAAAKAAPKAATPAPAVAAPKGKGGRYITLALVAVLGGLGFQAVYVARAKEAMKFDFLRNGKIISQGLADGQSTGPKAIVGDPQGNLFFLDGEDRPEMRLQKYDHAMEFVAKYKPKTAEGALPRAKGLGVDAKGNVYALSDDNRVVVLDNDLKFVRAFKVPVAEASCLTADDEGRIYISSRADNKIQMFDANGQALGEFGAPGTKSGDLAAPVRLTMSDKGELVVLEDIPETPRFKVFDKDHKLERSFRATGMQMCPPVMLGVDNKGLLYLNDPAGTGTELVFRLSNGKEIGTVKGTTQGDLFIAPGGSAANRFTGDVYVHTIPGLIPCAMPAGH